MDLSAPTIRRREASQEIARLEFRPRDSSRDIKAAEKFHGAGSTADCVGAGSYALIRPTFFIEIINQRHPRQRFQARNEHLGIQHRAIGARVRMIRRKNLATSCSPIFS